MIGWRARLGFLVPPGNPTVEPEMMQLAPPGVSVHFTRMFAEGATGSHAGMDERIRMQIAHLEDNVRLLALVKPDVIVMAHAGMSYALGKDGEAELVERLTKSSGIPFLTAFGGVVRALNHLDVQRLALGTPYEVTGAIQTGRSSHSGAVVQADNASIPPSRMDKRIRPKQRISNSLCNV